MNRIRPPVAPVCPNCTTNYWVRLNKQLVIRGNQVFECKKCGVLLTHESGIIPGSIFKDGHKRERILK